MSEMMLTFILACTAAGCAGNQYADPMAAESGNADCGTDAYAKLVAAEAIDLARVCNPTPVDKCATILKQPVIDKWKPRWDAWEACK